MLDPDAQRVVDAVRKARPYETMTPQEIRADYRNARFASQPPAQEVAAVDNFHVPGPRGDIPVRSYRPLGSQPQDILPALVFCHGGGFTIGDLDTHDTLCRELCNGANYMVFAVDYRLGPEHKFPAGHDDAFAALQWVAANAGKLHIDPKRIAVGGDSAGANISAVSALRARDAGGPHLAFQLLIYPGTDFRCIAPSHQRNGEGYLLTKVLIDYFCDCYLNSGADRLNWQLSPALAPDLSGLPPVLVLTAGFDPLVDEGGEYAELLRKAGGEAEHVCFEEQIHGFITMGRIIRQANEAVALCADRLKSVAQANH